MARVGGDEFTVLLLDTGNLAFIKDIARNILAELDRPFRLGEDEVKVSASTDRWTSLAGLPFQISVNTSPMQFTRSTQDEFQEADLDAFGTGYSSLAYLKRFNVNYLKLDPSFVQSDNPDSGGRTIAESIIAMAHNLGIPVIAKGVETAEQKGWLKAAGCDFAQGHYFSTPLPMEEFSTLLHSRSHPSETLSINRH